MDDSNGAGHARPHQQQSLSSRQSLIGFLGRVRPSTRSHQHQQQPPQNNSNLNVAGGMDSDTDMPHANGPTNGGGRGRPSGGYVVQPQPAAPPPSGGGGGSGAMLTSMLRRRPSLLAAAAAANLLPIPPSGNSPPAIPATSSAAPGPAAGQGMAHNPHPNNKPNHIRLVPHLESTHSLRFEPISRSVREGDPPLRIGRFTDRSREGGVVNNAAGGNRLAFRSKVVSRGHAEVWAEGGKFYIRDTSSSSGTFLNHQRLAAPGQLSRPHALKDGDIVQLGVDFQGGTQDIYKCVKIRVEIGREWQKSANAFNAQAMQALRSLTRNVDDADSADITERRKSKAGGKGKKSSGQDCCICLFSLQICQSIFVAPCSHAFHYKCIRPLLVQQYPGFSCPLCRTWADLEEDVEVEEDDGSASDDEIDGVDQDDQLAVVDRPLTPDAEIPPPAVPSKISSRYGNGAVAGGAGNRTNPYPALAGGTLNGNAGRSLSRVNVQETDVDAEMYSAAGDISGGRGGGGGGVSDAEFSMPITSERVMNVDIEDAVDTSQHTSSHFSNSIEAEAERQAVRDGGRNVDVMSDEEYEHPSHSHPSYPQTQPHSSQSNRVYGGGVTVGADDTRVVDEDEVAGGGYGGHITPSRRGHSHNRSLSGDASLSMPRPSQSQPNLFASTPGRASRSQTAGPGAIHAAAGGNGGVRSPGTSSSNPIVVSPRRSHDSPSRAEYLHAHSGVGGSGGGFHSEGEGPPQPVGFFQSMLRRRAGSMSMSTSPTSPTAPGGVAVTGGAEGTSQGAAGPMSQDWDGDEGDIGTSGEGRVIGEKRKR